MKYLLVAFLFSLSFALNAQTEGQINSELTKRGITTQSAVDAELAKRGMTENDAKRMAAMYGIDYDSYIAKYISPAATKTNVAPKNTAGETVSEIIYTEDVLKGSSISKGGNRGSADPDPAYFGYSIFQNNPFANKAYLVGNIDEGYILSPGDELRIYIWGANTYQAQVKIDLNGNIALPDNGVFFASGQTLKNFKKKLTNYLGKSYNGLLTTTPTSFIDVSLTQLRPVSITVLGESNTPGPHLINGFATVLNALYASGGIKTSGSLREIKIYRDNKLLKTIDLYNYITKGALDKYVRLMNNDIIFIPNRFSTITLAGAVRKEGIFELKPTEGLNELIKFSGGLLTSAAPKILSINRIIPFKDRKKDDIYTRKITSVNFAELLKNKENYQLFDGDGIYVNKILPKVTNKVRISGAVNRPGAFPISKFQDLRSLIVVAADSLAPGAYTKKIDLFRVNKDGARYFKTFNLEQVLLGEVNTTLQDDDEVVVYDMSQVKDQALIKISGFVKDPKTLFWIKDITLYDVLFSATNLEELEYRSKILTSRVDIKRFNASLGKFEIQRYDLNNIISREKVVLLLPKDEVIVYSKDINRVLDETVSINGYVKKGGTYTLSERMTVEDLILQAGGFTEYADKITVNVSRPTYDVEKGELSVSHTMKINIDYLTGVTKEIAKDAFFLKHQDVVNIRQIEGYEAQRTISLSGEIRHPGTFTLTNKRQSINDLISEAGGLTPFASMKASFIQRNGKKFIYDMGGNNNDLNFLEGGDQIVIASNYGTVNVVGAVVNEGLFVWEQGKRVKSYLRRSGFSSKNTEKVIVTSPNGITTKKKWFNNPTLLPNSSIYVHAKVKKERIKGDGEGMRSFIEILSVVTGALTTALLVSRF